MMPNYMAENHIKWIYHKQLEYLINKIKFKAMHRAAVNMICFYSFKNLCVFLNNADIQHK